MALKKSIAPSILSISGKLHPSIAFSTGIFLFFTSSFFTLPLIDGWSNFPGASKSLFPYRDYYYPVPPFTYFEAQVFSNFQLPSISLRIFHIILGGSFTVSLYYLASKFADKKDSLIVAIFCSAILSSLRLEPAGGWNTQSIMLSTIAITFYVYGWMNDNQQKKFGFLAGIIFFLSALTKQTILIPFAMLIISSILIGIRNKNNSVLRLIKYTVLAQIISGVILIVFLRRNLAMEPFIKMMLTSGGKNLAFNDLANKIAAGMIDTQLSYHSLFLIILILLHYFKKLIKNENWFDTAYIYLLILLSINIFSNLNIIYQLSVSLVLFLFYNILKKPFNRKWDTLPNLMIILICPVVIGIINSPTNEQSISKKIKNYLFTDINLEEFWMTLAFLIILIFLIKIKTTEKSSKIYQVNFLIAIYVVSNLFSAVLSSGGSYFLFWFIPVLIVGIPFLISSLRNSTVRNWKLTYAMLLIVLLFSTISAIGKTLDTPYSWWGWTEPSVFQQNRIVVDGGYYKGLPVTQAQQTFMKLIAKYESEAASLSPITPVTLYSFPNIIMTQSLTSITNYSGLSCLIAWFDLCPDTLAREDLEKFKDNPPSVVVWSQPTEGAFLVHEKLFLRSRSALRDWNNYRLSQFEKGSWKLVGYVPPSDMNLWPIQIYAVMQK